VILSQLFHLCNLLVLPGWLLLIVAPAWRWTQRITTFILTLPLAALYLGLFLANWSPNLSFGSLDQVYAIFQSPPFVLIGWIHYLVFDLFIGSWEVRDARQLHISHLLVIPCLVATFLVGPVGLMLYLLLRLSMKRKIGAET
jgi:predicted ferric reductase